MHASVDAAVRNRCVVWITATAAGLMWSDELEIYERIMISNVTASTSLVL